MAEIRAGKMDPKLGTTLGYLGVSFTVRGMRIIITTERADD
jgi:hypothetical protein